jgi:superfamily I DNA and RNA helicase
MPDNLDTILQIVTLVGVGFAVYKSWRDPDEQASRKIAVMEATCLLKHQAIDDNIILIKNNHLKHIEEDIAFLKNEQTKIITILEERLPKK